MARGGRAGRRAERDRAAQDDIDGLGGLTLMPHSWPGVPPDELVVPMRARRARPLSASPLACAFSDEEKEPLDLESTSLPSHAFASPPPRPSAPPVPHAREPSLPSHAFASPFPRPSAPPVPHAHELTRPYVPDLPAECIMLIIAHLAIAADLVAVQRLNKTWLHCAACEEHWRKLCVAAWPVCSYESSRDEEPAGAPTSWKERYVAMLTQRALAWGDTPLGARAQPTAFSLPMPFGCYGELATRALASRSIREISFGRRHAALLTHAGHVWTVGAGVDGALGHGDTLPISVPRRVDLLASRELCAVSCGVAHTAVLTVEHEAILWGLNSSGQLGTGDTVRCAVPHAAPAVCSLPPIGAIACGGTHTLLGALFGPEVWVLGDDLMSTGHVATPHPPGVELVPRLVLLPGRAQAHAAEPARPDEGRSAGTHGAPARCVVASDGFSAVSDSEGVLWTWGAESAAGRLGRELGGDEGPGAHEPGRVRALDGRVVVGVAASSGHVSAVCDDGSVWAWGKGTLGQLGLGSRTNSALPKAVVAASGTGGRQVVQVAVGEAFSLARTRRGDVLCWGQLTNGARTVPKPVKALSHRGTAVVRLAAGGGVAAALVRWAPLPAAAAGASPPQGAQQRAGGSGARSSGGRHGSEDWADGSDCLPSSYPSSAPTLGGALGDRSTPPFGSRARQHGGGARADGEARRAPAAGGSRAEPAAGPGARATAGEAEAVPTVRGFHVRAAGGGGSGAGAAAAERRGPGGAHAAPPVAAPSCAGAAAAESGRQWGRPLRSAGELDVLSRELQARANTEASGAASSAASGVAGAPPASWLPQRPPACCRALASALAHLPPPARTPPPRLPSASPARCAVAARPLCVRRRRAASRLPPVTRPARAAGRARVRRSRRPAPREHRRGRGAAAAGEQGRRATPAALRHRPQGEKRQAGGWRRRRASRHRVAATRRALDRARGAGRDARHSRLGVEAQALAGPQVWRRRRLSPWGCILAILSLSAGFGRLSHGLQI